MFSWFHTAGNIKKFIVNYRSVFTSCILHWWQCCDFPRFQIDHMNLLWMKKLTNFPTNAHQLSQTLLILTCFDFTLSKPPLTTRQSSPQYATLVNRRANFCDPMISGRSIHCASNDTSIAALKHIVSPNPSNIINFCGVCNGFDFDGLEFRSVRHLSIESVGNCPELDGVGIIVEFKYVRHLSTKSVMPYSVAFFRRVFVCDTSSMRTSSV